MSKKKRERRKKCRRKSRLTVEQASQINKAVGRAWNMPEVHLILNRFAAAPYEPKQFEKLKNFPTCSSSFLLSEYNNKLLEELNEHCVCDIQSFTAIIRRKFIKARLGRVLNDCLPMDRNCSPVKMINMFVTSKQLNAFVARLFTIIFPIDLLGETNWTILRKNISRLFTKLRLRGEVATFNEIFRRIRLSDISWLRNLPFKLKYSIIKDILEYIIVFFINFMCISFYSTMNSSGRIVHYRRSIWRKIEKRGFAILCAQRMLKTVKLEYKNVSPDDFPIHQLRFLPKKGDVRPIVTFKSGKIMRELAEVRAILTLITDENPAIFGWGISNLRYFNVAYRRLMLTHKHSQNSTKYWCTMDLANCFTNINHEILEKILRRLIPSTRSFTVVRVTIENEKLKKRFLVRVAGSNFTNAMSRLRLQRDNERIASNPIGEDLSGEDVLARIRRFALCTIIARNGLLYQCGRGIAQGNPLSVKLCNIYLGSMERMLFPQRPKELFCRRYIDDYIIISSSKQSVVQMVNKVITDGIRFGVQANNKKVLLSFTDKTIYGAKSLKSNRKMPWCGFAFNMKNLRMTIDYQRYRQCRPRYSISMKIHLTARLRFICATAKRLLKGRSAALRSCARLMNARQRKSLRVDFRKYARDFYFRHFIRQFQLDMRDRSIHLFLSQMIRWVDNGFREKSLPDAVNPSICEL